MGLLIDLGILSIILISTLIGYKRGLIKVAFGLLSFLIAIIISLLLYKPVSNFITNYTPIPDRIETQIESRLSSEDKEETNNFVENYYNNIKNSSVSIISHNMTNSIINISTNIVSKLPLIKQLNHVGGFIYGILAGFIIVYFVLTIISLLAPIIDLNSFIKLINTSIIGNIMYNNNIIFMFLM